MKVFYMQQIISKKFNDIEIVFSLDENIYLNATQTAKKFKTKRGNPKDINEWLSSKATKEYLESLKKVVPEKTGNGFIIIKQGGKADEQGTWIHQKLIILFARWLNPDFAVWCDLQIEEILKSKNSQSSQNKTEDPITKRVQLIHHSKELYDDFEHVFQKIGIEDKTELAITTNRAVKNETTIDFITLSGKNGLEVSEKFYTVTELCNLIRNSDEFSDEIKKLVSTKNNQKARPQNLNLLLEQNGFQIKELNEWKATQKGEKFSKFVQNKSLSSTKNIFHLNWSFDVLSEVF